MYCYLAAHDFALNVWRHTYFPSNSWRFVSTVLMCESVADCMHVHGNVCVRDNSNVKRSVCIGFNVAAKSNHCKRSAVRLTEMSHFLRIPFSTKTFSAACMCWWCIYFDLINIQLRTMNSYCQPMKTSFHLIFFSLEIFNWWFSH